MYVGDYQSSYFHYPYTGLMDEVRLYSRALSSGEVNNLYHYNTNLIGTGGTGDTNNDGHVDNNDYNIWYLYYGLNVSDSLPQWRLQ